MRTARRCRRGARRNRPTAGRSGSPARSGGGLERMARDPVARDLDAAADPDAVVALDVVEKARERGEAPGAPGEPAVQPDREHLRRFLAFGIQRVEGIAQIGEELLAAV